MDDLDQALAAVGPRLRMLRSRRELTLAELSTRTGISMSTLSRLESGARRPTLELLLPLARAYGVTLDEMVGAPPTGDPRVHLRPATMHGMTVLPLTRRPGGIQAFKMIILPGRHGDPQPQGHEGYDWIYVLNGRLRLILGTHDMVLTPGEAAEFDTRTPHWFGAAGAEPVEILSLFGTQGERAHLRVRPRETREPTEAGEPSEARQPSEAREPSDARQPSEASTARDSLGARKASEA
ncbi:helix-turn-helix domain-containing protein [Actinoplanes sp. N902-109]|uniref:helix-turn-helix domain-containing protein n=1 Tax=Actinoplanes sp. (strain N902-109) TaxID=649831 RepID=UPI0003293E0A|nr:XRE family transcriptional regulator [Actinoplanes sp. N902-109]AGL20041.1 XRE family transcriptional regulator [Actinoplanes sp. N902-109]